MPVVLCIIFSTKVSTLVCHVDLIKIGGPLFGGLTGRMGYWSKGKQQVETHAEGQNQFLFSKQSIEPLKWRHLQRGIVGFFSQSLCSRSSPRTQSREPSEDVFLQLQVFKDCLSRWRNSSDGTGLDLRKKPGAWCNDVIQIYTVTEGRNSSW